MATINAVADGLWSDPNTWDAGVPGSTDRVVINNHDVELDTTAIIGDGTRSTSLSESVSQLVVKGTGRLKFSRSVDSYLGVKGMIYVRPSASNQVARFDMGTPGDPIPEGVTATLNLNEEGSTHLGYYYGAYFVYYNSTAYASFTAKSAVERRRNTYLIGAFDAGSTQITVNDATNWRAGDKLYLAPRYTGKSFQSRTQEFEVVTVQSVNGNDITLTAGTQYDHGYSDSSKHVFAGVLNMTSNVIIRGYGDSAPMYAPYPNRAEVNLQDIVFEYANNGYNYHTVALRNYYGGYYADSVIKRVAAWGDQRNWSRHHYGFSFPYTAINDNGHAWEYEDVGTAIIAVKNGYRAYYTGGTFYYGGRATVVKDAFAYGVAETDGGTSGFAYYGPQSYQQPSILEGGGAYGIQYSIVLQNNINSRAKNFVVAGAGYPLSSYNGSAIYEDAKIHSSSFLSRYWNPWACEVHIVRPTFDPAYINKPNEGDLLYYTGKIPSGSYVAMYDINNDPKRQESYYADGVYIRDTQVKATSVASIRVETKHSTKTTPLAYSKTRFVTAGSSLTVSAKLRKDSSWPSSSRPRLRVVGDEFDVSQDMPDSSDTWEDVTLTTPQLSNDGRLEVRIEFPHVSSGKAWVDDYRIGEDLIDIGTDLWGRYGTETSNVVDVTDKNKYVTLTDVKPGSNIDVFLGTLDDSSNATLLDSVDNLSGSEWTFAHQHSGENAYIVVQHINYGYLSVQLVLPAQRQTTIPIKQSVDRVYDNP